MLIFRVAIMYLFYNDIQWADMTIYNSDIQCQALLEYCITPIFRVEEIFAIFANWDFARNFPPAKIISTANGISRNFPPGKFTSREIFLPAKIKI